MRLALYMDMDNASFHDGESNGQEVARILRFISGTVDGMELAEGDEYAIGDRNGNKVGRMRVFEHH